MNMTKYLFVLLSSSIILSCSNESQQSDSAGTKTSDKVESLLAEMTLEEKIGQMNLYSNFWQLTGPAPESGDAKMKYDHLKEGKLGAVLNVHGHEDARKWQEIAVNETRLGIPLLFGFDVIHGHRTLSPIPLAESCSWDLEAIELSAKMAAKEAAAMGINWTFAPNVDITRDARWGRVMEGAGEDPYLGSLIAEARVKGFQGDDLSSPETIAACAKHFAGYGFPTAGRDYNTVDVGTYTLYNHILPPFKAAVDADAKTLMNAFNTLNGVPGMADSFLQREILKGKWAFEGFVVSDWGTATEMIDHGFSKDLLQSAELAANAGSDMDMEGYAYVHHLKEAVENGDVDVEVINDAVRRILGVKEDLGLFEDPFRYIDAEREAATVGSDEIKTAAREMAKKSIVLLKNENNLLPLKSDQGGIALIGALANDANSVLGSWRLGALDNTAVTIKEGMSSFNPNIRFERGPDFFRGAELFGEELQVNETDKNGLNEAVNAARSADVVVLVLGEHGYQSGEGRSRTRIGLPGFQQEMLEEIHKVNKNIVLVLTNGRPLDLTWANENIPAIIEAWQLGTECGNALSSVLFGETNPSAKLTTTFPRTVGQVPLHYNQFSTGRPGPKTEVWWSHYIDESNDPLYPFGYGLSYTTYEYGDLSVDDSDQKNIKVSIDVSNKGSVDGEEIVQLYIRDRFASLVRPVKELKGFEKVALAAGETKSITFSLTENELGFFNAEGEFIVEPGEFAVMVGPNSRDVQTKVFELKEI